MNESVQTIISLLLLVLAVGFVFRNILFKRKSAGDCGCEKQSCACAPSDIKN